MNDFTTKDPMLQSRGEVKFVYELPKTADPFARPVNLQDLLSLDEFHSEEPPPIDVRFELVRSLANALYEMHCAGWLHRNISSERIFFLRTGSGSRMDSIDPERPYVTGFEAARPFTAAGSLRFLFSGITDDLAFQHPGYLLYRRWALLNADEEYTGDKLFYMPRHDYYSMGLVFLEVGLWRILRRTVLQDKPLFNESFRTEYSEGTFDKKLEILTEDATCARVGDLYGPNPDDEMELERRLSLQDAYANEGHRLVEEEGLTGFALSKDCKDEFDERGTWWSWDQAYGVHMLRQDALRLCLDKLGSRMGRRYREAVRRCLATDFGVPPRSSKDIEWLRAFNWRVVQELSKCSA